MKAGDRLFLGIECGGTRTVALLVNGNQPIKRIEIGPANLRLLSDAELARHFRSLRASFPRPTAIAIGMAGARTPADNERIRRCAARVWPQSALPRATILESHLAAGELAGSTRSTKAGRNQTALILVLSGTVHVVSAGPRTERRRKLAAGATFWVTKAAVTRLVCVLLKRWFTTTTAMESGRPLVSISCAPCN